MQREKLRDRYVTSLKKLCPSVVTTLCRVYEEAAKKCYEFSTVSSFRKLRDEISEDIFRLDFYIYD